MNETRSLWAVWRTIIAASAILASSCSVESGRGALRETVIAISDGQAGIEFGNECTPPTALLRGERGSVLRMPQSLPASSNSTVVLKNLTEDAVVCVGTARIDAAKTKRIQANRYDVIVVDKGLERVVGQSGLEYLLVTASSPEARAYVERFDSILTKRIGRIGVNMPPVVAHSFIQDGDLALSNPVQVGPAFLCVGALDAESAQQTVRTILLNGLSSASVRDLRTSGDLWLAYGTLELLAASLAEEVLGCESAAGSRFLQEAYLGTYPWGFSPMRGPATEASGYRGREGEIEATARQVVWQQYAAPFVLDRWLRLEQGLVGQPYLTELLAIYAKLASGGAGIYRRMHERASREAQEWAKNNIDSEPLIGVPYDAVAHRAERLECPTLVLALTEHGGGFIENCGCVVNQAGGMSRRNALLKRERSMQPGFLAIDLGRALPSPVRESTPDSGPERVQLIWSLFREGGYDLVVPDYLDWLHMPSEMLEGDGSYLFSTNAGHGQRRLSPEPWRSMVNGVDTYVFASTGLTWRSSQVLSSADLPGRQWVYRTDPIEALLLSGIQALPESAFVVVCGQISSPLAEQLVVAFPNIDLILTSNHSYLGVVSGDDMGQPRTKQLTVVSQSPTRKIGSTWVVAASAEAYGYTRVEVAIDRSGTIQDLGRSMSQFHPGMAKDEASERLIAEYYKAEFGSLDWDLPPMRPENGANGGGYVGTDACRSCHVNEYSTWKVSAHGNAWNTLLAAQRDLNPECVQCHVVGMGEPTGFDRIGNPASGLAGVGCEVCHGGGALHVTDPFSNTMDRGQGNYCIGCHDGKHSPDFDYHAYWEQIKH